jgi:Tfp pilus assembly protein PilX
MKRARNDDGFALVSAIVLLTVIMALGLGLLLFTDNQQKASAREQASEAAFNVAEAALAQMASQRNRNASHMHRRHEHRNKQLPQSHGCESGSQHRVDDMLGYRRMGIAAQQPMDHICATRHR